MCVDDDRGDDDSINSKREFFIHTYMYFFFFLEFRRSQRGVKVGPGLYRGGGKKSLPHVTEKVYYRQWRGVYRHGP